MKHFVCYRSIMSYCDFPSAGSSWTARATGPKDQLEKKMDRLRKKIGPVH